MAAEVALAAFSSIVEAAKYLVKKIQQETSYVFKYQSYLDGLNNQVEQLGYTRERVEQPVNHAKQLGDEIYEDVAVWLKSFDDFTEKVVKPINAYEDEAKKRCFKGSCLNLFKRYSLSKKAEKASKEGADLLARGNFPIVSYHPVARDLERKVKQLEFLRQRVEKDVEHAERQGEQIFEAVKDWLIRVKDFSDKAVNASEEVDNLLREGNFTKVSYLPAPDRTKLKNVKYYVGVVDEKNYWEGNLNSTIEKKFKEMVGFRKIHRLRLSLFPSLREIWHGQELPVSLFNNLRDLVVDDCIDMSSAISMHLLRCLNNLESLKICNCDSLEEVFHLEELNAGEYFWSIFPKLKKLKLIHLPKLQRFCNFIGHIIELHALSYLRIENCPNMEAFISNSTSVPMIGNKEPLEMTSEENFLLLNIQPFFDGNKVFFPCLIVLKLSRLPKLLHLWRENYQSWEVFESLTTLQISECDKLEKIVQEVGEEVKKECIVFMELKYLGLDCLPSLTSFCLGNYIIEFPSLMRVVVKECPNMKTFSQGVLYTPKLHKLQVKGKEEQEDEDDEDEDEDEDEDDDDDDDDDDDEDDYEGRWEGDLNSTIQQLFKEVNTLN